MRFGLLLLLACATTAQAQTTLRVNVADATSGTFVPAAVVTINRSGGTPLRAETDSTGSALFSNLRAGTYTISVRSVGYEPLSGREVDVEAETSTNLLLSLSPAPLSIDAVQATATPQAPQSEDLKLNGFYERMKFNNGIFVDRVEIEKRKQRLVSDLIRSKQGVNLRRVPGGEQVLWFRASEMPGFSSAGVRTCGPSIYLDGLVVFQSDGQSPAPIDRFVNTDDLVGIEIYRRPSQIPEQYGGAHSGCGVVLLWTRLRS